MHREDKKETKMQNKQSAKPFKIKDEDMKKRQTQNSLEVDK